MPKLLIVSPRFPPINAADLHRVRQSLPYYARYGWEATVLCVDAATADGVQDPMLERSLPEGVSIVRVRAWREAACRRFGFGEFSYRSLLPLYRAGRRLLRQEPYEIVFFSTTAFLSFVLGRLWKRRYGCRIVYDFQDPWYAEELTYTPATVPGRWWKHRLGRWLARHLERFALKAADHIISVSAGYIEQLARRYPRLGPAMFTLLPFGAEAEDYAFARRALGRQAAPADRRVRWVSVGRAGPDMDPVLEALFEVLAKVKTADPSFVERLRLSFIGTNYAPPERTRKLVEPLALAFGVGDLVEESPRRIPYFEAISRYAASDAILLMGSADADYTASKLLTCVLSNKPILALFHRWSLVSEIAARFPNVFLATFDETPAEPDFRARVAEGIAWLRTDPRRDAVAIAAAAAPWSAEALTRRQCAIFDRLSLSLITSQAETADARRAMNEAARYRLAIIVSHPIPYFAPLHERLARRDDIELKVFFTWHAGERPVHDRGFGQDIAWDISLTAGYPHELVPNSSSDPGTHHFLGLRNPSLVDRVTAWRPDIVLVHGWAWLSHLQALRALRHRGIPTLLRGDSHLLDEPRAGPRWRVKQLLLRRFLAWPSGFLVAGAANRAYYEAFAAPKALLFPCPHSIDVARFAEPAPALEAAAARWRQELGIAPDQIVVLFAGKFERRKRPLDLARAVLGLDRSDAMVVLVGGGELQGEVDAIAAARPDRVRVLPFQNQSRMPIVYRLGDLFVLPSEHGETWGLAVNEALACGRPVVVSDRVGCAADVVEPSCGRIFAWHDLSALRQVLREMTDDRARLVAMRAAATQRAQLFDVSTTEQALIDAVGAMCGR